MKQNTQPLPIYIDGQPAPAYVQALQQAKRRHMYKLATKHLKRAGKAVIVFLGIQILECYAGLLDGMYHTQQLAELRQARLQRPYS